MDSGRPRTPENDGGFPSMPEDSPGGGAPSIISSRISDVGDESRPKSAAAKEPEGASKSISKQSEPAPGEDSSQPPVSQTHQTSESAPRTNDNPVRSRNLAGRSHVPSLTSNAFFRPMSSQKLQAHRAAGSRSTATTQQQQQQHQHSEQQQLDFDDGATDIGGSVMPRQSISSNTPLGIQRIGSDDNLGAPPSRGTEATDPHTVNTSPTNGHYPTGSLSDSVRPLNKASASNANNMSINVDKSYRDLGRGAPSPITSPISLRSGFMRGRESAQDRRTEGAEKLSSCPSTPKYPPGSAPGQSQATTSHNNQQQNGGRVHQYFDGNTTFCFGGRWQNTRGRQVNIATGLFTTVPLILWLAFVAPWAWSNMSPAVPITFAYLTFVCVSSFFHASVSDPGILPRNLHQFPVPDENTDPLRLGPPTNDWMLVKSAESRTAAMEVPVKHCRTCNIWRPPRAHHCRVCDNCIDGHDHHCVWLNNCIGRRNYRFFFAYLGTGTILALYVMATTLYQLLDYAKEKDIKFGDAVGHFRISFALFILGFIALCYPAALMGYHLFLISRGETTREYLNSHKFAKDERFRAFSEAKFWRNFIVVLCRPRPPTYYRFKSQYKHGDQRLGAVPRRQRPKEYAHGMEMQNVQPGSQAGSQGSQGGFQGPTALRSEA